MPSLEASLRNLEKARAAWTHPPRPWRSLKESCAIEQLVWQWYGAGEGRKWSLRAVARWLGVSHTYVEKLERKFRANPGRMRRIQAGFGQATFETLERARELTRQDRERGYLRSPRRLKWAEFKVGSNTVRWVVPTKAEERRRAAEAMGRSVGPVHVPPDELPSWAVGRSSCPPQNSCDPLAAVKEAAWQTAKRPPLAPHRRRGRWLPPSWKR